MPARSHSSPTLAFGLEFAARSFAGMPRDQADLMIEQQVATAIREWRVADATTWQRVKFRSRMIRIMDAHRVSDSGKV